MDGETELALLVGDHRAEKRKARNGVLMLLAAGGLGVLTKVLWLGTSALVTVVLVGGAITATIGGVTMTIGGTLRALDLGQKIKKRKALPEARVIQR